MGAVGLKSGHCVSIPQNTWKTSFGLFPAHVKSLICIVCSKSEHILMRAWLQHGRFAGRRVWAVLFQMMWLCWLHQAVSLHLSLEWFATQREAAGMRFSNSKTIDKQRMENGRLIAFIGGQSQGAVKTKAEGCVTMLYVSCLIYVKTLAAVRPMAVCQNSTFYFFSLEVMRTQFIYDSSLLHVRNDKTKKKVQLSWALCDII